MSSLTRCNFCTLRRMRELAAARGVSVIVEPVPAEEIMGGWTTARYSDKDRPSAWFMALSDRCVC